MNNFSGGEFNSNLFNTNYYEDLEDVETITNSQIDKLQLQFEEQRSHLESSGFKFADRVKAFDKDKQTMIQAQQELCENLKELDKWKKDNSSAYDEVLRLEGQCKKLKDKKINDKDEVTIGWGQKKLQLYKDLTGLRWDYAISETQPDLLRGYVCDKVAYAEPFSFTRSDKKLIERLWHEISLGAKFDPTNIKKRKTE